MSVAIAPSIIDRTDNVGRSQHIWRGHDQRLLNDPDYGVYNFDNFVKFLAGNTEYDVGASDVNPILSDTVQHALNFVPAATDNNQSYLSLGGGDKGNLLNISATQGSGSRTMLEARVLFTSVADLGFIFGFGDPAMANADPMTDDTMALPDNDFVGFRVLSADPDGLDAVYKPVTGAEAVVTNEAQVLVINTWYRIGVLYNPKPDSDRPYYVEYYVDNVRVGELTWAQVNAATFPIGVHMVPMIGIKTGEAVAKTLTLDSLDYGLVF